MEDTILEAKQNILKFLKDKQKEHKKLKDIKSGSDWVEFRYGNICYVATIEDLDHVIFSPNGVWVDGEISLKGEGNLDLWETFEEGGEWNMIEDYFEDKVLSGEYDDIANAWATFQKLEKTFGFEDDVLTKLAAKYFYLTE